MTWLARALAVERAGGQMEMIGARHSARLRGAIMGKNKSDVIDSEVLTHAGEIFDPPPLVLVSPGQLVLGRWPHLPSLASARAATLTAVVAEHTRSVADTPARAAAIKAAARGWADFWEGHLDLDALAVDVTEHLADLQESRARVERFTSHARQWWEHLYGDDPLILSLPGVGPATGPCIRAYFGDGSGFDCAKKAANYVGITPSMVLRDDEPVSPGHQQGRTCTAAPGLLPGRQRRPDHGPAAVRVLPPVHDRTRTLPHTGHHRGRQETGRKNLENPHHRSDVRAPRPRGQPVTKRAAKELIASRYAVTPKQRTQSRSHTIEAKRARLTR